MRTPTKHVTSSGPPTWKVRYRDGKQQSSQTFDTKKEADRFATLVDTLGVGGALAQLNLELHSAAAAKRATLNDVAAAHIKDLTGVQDGTRLNYERLWARTWGPLIGHLPANLVTKSRVAGALNTLALHYSPKSLKNQRGLLCGVCDRAVDEGHLVVNPTKRLRIAATRSTSKPIMRLITQTDMAHLIQQTSDHYQPFMLFLAGTGCRWGEAVALAAGDVHLDEVVPTVLVHRSLKWSPDNQRFIGPTKTAKSTRTVALPMELVPVLAPLKEGKGNGDLLFTAPRGGPVMHRTFWTDIWLPALKRAGLMDPRPRIHDIRHSHASWLLGNGVPITVVQARLGHESITTTVDTYGHLLPDAQIAAAHAASVALTLPTPPLQLGEAS